MRIAVLGHLHHRMGEPFLGGLEAHTTQVTEALAARGHAVTLFARAGSTSPSGRVRIVPVLGDGVTWDETPRVERLLDAATARGVSLAADHDVVLNNSLSPVPYATPPRPPMLTVLHTPATLERVNLVVAASGWRARPTDVWVSVSDANAVGWRALLPDVAVGVVHNGIDATRWPLGHGGGALFWSARITPEKGLHVAIDAARATGLPLDIAGPVSDPAYFAREIAPRLGPDVRHLGHLDHEALGRGLAGARAFLATPLWDEPFGLAALEAMACGTPVAALAAGAMAELLGAAGGVLAATPADLPRAVIRAVALDRRAVRRRAETFSLSAMVAAYEGVLGSLQQRTVQPVVLRADPTALGDPVG